MSKYQKLSSHLASLKGSEWKAEFREIEALLGFKLPRSAYSYQAWWANQSGDSLAQCAAWQSIGWRTGDLDLASQRVTFLRHKSRKDGRTSDSIDDAKGVSGLTIAEAKAGLATYFGVSPDSVEITIKG